MNKPRMDTKGGLEWRSIIARRIVLVHVFLCGCGQIVLFFFLPVTQCKIVSFYPNPCECSKVRPWTRANLFHFVPFFFSIFLLPPTVQFVPSPPLLHPFAMRNFLIAGFMWEPGQWELRKRFGCCVQPSLWPCLPPIFFFSEKKTEV